VLLVYKSIQITKKKYSLGGVETASSGGRLKANGETEHVSRMLILSRF